MAYVLDVEEPSDVDTCSVQLQRVLVDMRMKLARSNLSMEDGEQDVRWSPSSPPIPPRSK